MLGSKAFRNLWEDWQRDYQPLQVLKLLLAYIVMAEDLSGELEETQHLLSYFDPEDNLHPATRMKNDSAFRHLVEFQFLHN